jgi:tetratricopeptide (TPR) repeat protein
VGSDGMHPRCLTLVIVAAIALSWVALSGVADLPIDTDDAGYLENSSRISADFLQILSPDLELAGRPATQLIFYLGFKLWGEDIRRFHLLLVGFHLLATALLVAAARRTGLHLGVALAAGAFFLLHAGHFRAVHWVSALAYPLALSGSLTAILCFQEHLRCHSRWWLAAAYAAALFGAFSHIAATAVLPACYLLALQQRQTARSSAKTLLPLAVVIAGSIWWLLRFFHDSPQVAQATEGLSATQALSYFPLLVGRLVSTGHWFFVPTHFFHGWEPYFGLPVLALLAGAAWRFPEIRLWACWPLATALLFSTSSDEVSSRYLYLPSAGTSVVLAWVLHAATTRAAHMVGRRASDLLFLCVTLVILVVSSIALRNTLAYSHYLAARHHMVLDQTERSLAQLKTAIGWGGDLVPREPAFVYLVSLSMTTGSGYREHLGRALADFPKSAGLNALQGVIETMDPAPALREAGKRRIEAAMIELQAAGEDAPERLAGFYHNMGKGYYQLARYDRALDAFRTSLRYQPKKRITAMGIIGSTYALGDFEGAAAAATAFADLWQRDVEILYWAVRSLREAGRAKEAVVMARRAVAIGPTQDLLLLQADLLLQSGARAAAAASFGQAIELAPTSHRPYAGLAQLLFVAGEYDKVASLLETAVARGATSGQIYFTLGNAHYAAGRLNAAREAYASALAVDFENLRIHSNLGVVLQKMGFSEEAAEVWRRVVQQDHLRSDKGRIGDYCRIAVLLGALYRDRGEVRELHELLARLKETRPGISQEVLNTAIAELESYSQMR